jgi:hypothetical protein
MKLLVERERKPMTPRETRAHHVTGQSRWLGFHIAALTKP